jgi:G3E family GTPase
VIKALNPGATITYAERGRVPLHKILGTGKFDLEKASEMAGWARELAGEHAPETEEYGISSFVLREPRALHPQRFNRFLDQAFPGLIRAKGYLWLATRPEWAVTYSRAGKIASVEPVGRWAEPYDDRFNEVVFIGQNLDRAAIEEAFSYCVLTDAEAAAGEAVWQHYADPFPQWFVE